MPYVALNPNKCSDKGWFFLSCCSLTTFNKILLSVYYRPDTTLGNTLMNKKDMSPAFRDLEKRQGTKTENKHCVNRVIWDRPQGHQACRKAHLRK